LLSESGFAGWHLVRGSDHSFHSALPAIRSGLAGGKSLLDLAVNERWQCLLVAATCSSGCTSTWLAGFRAIGLEMSLFSAVSARLTCCFCASESSTPTITQLGATHLSTKTILIGSLAVCVRKVIGG
jgi:hypothetical protein